jgi:hypothetical protein
MSDFWEEVESTNLSAGLTTQGWPGSLYLLISNSHSFIDFKFPHPVEPGYHWAPWVLPSAAAVTVLNSEYQKGKMPEDEDRNAPRQSQSTESEEYDSDVENSCEVTEEYLMELLCECPVCIYYNNNNSLSSDEIHADIGLIVH